jgi:hypothetical protein
MKKYLFLAAAILFAFAPALMVSATTENTSSGFEAVTFDSTIEFNAQLNSSGNVEASWSKYNKENAFTYYKLVRSATNSNPVYPDDGYIFYTSDVNTLTYTDTNVPTGTNYYRICQIASPKRYCSEKVVTITKNSTTGTNTTGQIVLTGNANGNSISLSWTYSDAATTAAARSFKVVWGKTSGPTYPLREGDNYHFITSGVNSDKISGLAVGKYYVRVCLYNNDACSVYSNELIFEINTSAAPTDTHDQIVCTEEYSPVCGTNNKTYSNACFAKKDGVKSYVSGECKKPTSATPDNAGQDNNTNNDLKIGSLTLDKPLSQMSRDELITVLIRLLIALLNK